MSKDPVIRAWRTPPTAKEKFMTKNEWLLDWLCRLRSDIQGHEVRVFDDSKFNKKYVETLNDVIELQKIRPEVEESEWRWWIQDGRSCVKCLKCGGLDSFHAPFCHWCGASMREVPNKLPHQSTMENMNEEKKCTSCKFYGIFSCECPSPCRSDTKQFWEPCDNSKE